MSQDIQRQRRSDFGQVRATERDLYLLSWIGDQFALRVDQLHQLASSYKGEELSFSTIKWLASRWQKAGWIHKQKLLAGQPQWIWLSREGLSDLGLDYPYNKPGVGRLNHIYHANAVRFWVERRSNEKASWVSERIVNARRKEYRNHLVDGEVLYNGIKIAVEVELTQKSRPRLISILRELQRDYEAVWYFAAEECYSAVKSAIESVPNHEKTFVLYNLATVFKEE